MPKQSIIINNFYSSRQRTGALNARAFWLLALASLILVLVYIFSVYLTVNISYQIEDERMAARKEEISRESLEEEYISRLEVLIDQGKNSLGLISPETRVFVDRYVFVARAGL